MGEDLPSETEEVTPPDLGLLDGGSAVLLAALYAISLGPRQLVLGLTLIGCGGLLTFLTSQSIFIVWSLMGGSIRIP